MDESSYTKRTGKILSIENAWENLLDKYSIIEKIHEHGQFHITADMIREYREPRLMAKWDATESLPKCLRDAKINILPVSRSEYIMSDFNLYEPLPDSCTGTPQYVEVPQYESIDPLNITSESNAINVLTISGILDTFLESRNTVETFNGRMGTGDFQFTVNRYSDSSEPLKISVRRAQLEIDGGFENNDSVIIMEAKNVLHPDFHIRQLYYPYRLWKTKIHKPIRLVFSQYSNLIFRLFEYEFANPEDYSSIRLLKQKEYSLQDTRITWLDLKRLYAEARIETTDNNEDNHHVPFIQANNFNTVITLLERLGSADWTDGADSAQIADFMEFDPRQSNYYSAAGEYLGLFDRSTRNLTKLSELGRQVLAMPYKQRQLTFVRQMLKHEIFYRLIGSLLQSKEISSLEIVQKIMNELSICSSPATARRRASTVINWMRWILSLPSEK